MKAAIEIQNLGKQYRRREQSGKRYKTLRDSLMSAWWKKTKEQDDDFFWALRHLDVSINPGEIMGVIGANGAGKSTLLKLLTRVTAPTEGSFTLRGRVASLLEVGTGFHPELTGRENIFLSGTIMGMQRAEIKRKFDEIVAFAGVEQFLDLPVKRYSSGMYVRLGFAVAAHLEAEILLVDEVLAVGDAAFQKKCLGKMDDVAQSGRTVLFVSHNLGAVRQLCSKGLLVENGTSIGEGTITDVVDFYIKRNQKNPLSVSVKRSDVLSSSGLVIKEIGVISKAGSYTSLLPYKFPLHIQIKIENKSTKQECGLVVGLNDSMGGRVLTSSSLEQKRSFLLQKGINVIDVQLPPLDIKPGRYSIYVSIARSFNLRLDSFTTNPFFEISNIGTNPNNNFSGYWGVIMVNAEWEVK